MTRRDCSIGAVLLALVTGACDSPTAPSVTAPHPVTPPPPPPPPTIEINFAFDDAFWDALVYNGHDKPEQQRYPPHVLPTTSPNFYIRRSTPDDTMPGCGRRWSLDDLAYMERMIPRLVENLTGTRYRGRVVSGCEDRRQAEWITIVSATTKEHPNLTNFCGRARVGAYRDGDGAGRIWFNEEPNYTCTRTVFRELLAHELGHAMRFWHVPNGVGYVMASGEYTGRLDFTIKERQHAQHAYKRGRNAPFCHNALTCASRAFGFTQRPVLLGESLGTPPELP